MTAIFIVGIIFFLFFSYNPQTNYFAGSWYLVIQAGITFLCYEVYKITSIPIALFFLYVLTSGTYFSQCNFNHFCLKLPNLAGPFVGRLSKTLVCTIGLLLILVYISPDIIRYFVKASPFLLLIGALYPLIPEKYRIVYVYKGLHFLFCRPKRTAENKNMFIDPPYFGYGANPSVHATFMSLLAPFTLFNLEISDFYFYFTIISLFFTLICLISMKASAGLGAFLAMGSVFLFYKIGFWVLIPIVFSLITLYFLNKHYYEGKLFYLSGREAIIKHAWDHLRPRKGFVLCGNGVGSTSFLMPITQLELRKKEGMPPGNSVMRQIFVFLHSDLCQWYLDGGIIGIVLLLIAFSDSIYHAYNAPVIMSFIAAFIVSGIINFPCHMGKDSLLAIIMIRLIYAA